MPGPARCLGGSAGRSTLGDYPIAIRQRPDGHQRLPLAGQSKQFSAYLASGDPSPEWIAICKVRVLRELTAIRPLGTIAADGWSASTLEEVLRQTNPRSLPSTYATLGSQCR